MKKIGTLWLNIQPLDWISYKECMLAIFAVIDDLEKHFEKPIEQFESWLYQYKLLQNTSVQLEVKKRIVKVYVYRTEKSHN